MTSRMPPLPLGVKRIDPEHQACETMIENAAHQILHILGWFRPNMGGQAMLIVSPTHEVIIREKSIIGIGQDGKPKLMGPQG